MYASDSLFKASRPDDNVAQVNSAKLIHILKCLAKEQTG